MSDSDRRRFSKARLGLIAVGLVALLFTGVVIYPALQVQREIYDNAARNSASYSEGAKKDIAIQCVGLAVEERKACSSEKNDAARKEQRDEYDLAAQETMALWTGIMGGMAVLGIGLSAVVAYLVLGTWKDTRRTAHLAERNFKAFARFESAVLTVKFAKPPTFFVEDKKMHMRFELKCLNGGRSPAFVSSVGIEGLKTLYYSFFCKADGEEGLDKSYVVPIGGKNVIYGYTEYSTQIENGNRRRFRIALTVKEKPGACKASIFDGGVLRKGDDKYEKPFD